MQRTLVVNVAGLSVDLVPEMPSLAALAGRGACLPMEPVLPATTLPMQATLLTGVPPARHGIVANGFYFHDTAEVRFWEQSARLLAAPRVWDLAAEGRVMPSRGRLTPSRGRLGHRGGSARGRRARRPRVAMLFWQLAMYSTADVILTPKPIHAPGDRLIPDCYSRPADLYRRLADGESSLEPGRPRGPFDLGHYWGPMAGLASSRWIADAALAVWREERPDLLLAYLPHLDYSGHREGPASPRHRAEARALDALLAPLLDAAASDGARAVVLSEYSFLPVSRPVALNRALREAGLLAVREVEGCEYLYPGDCRAFAMADNQVAHVYLPAATDLEAAARKAKRLLARADGVAEVLDRQGQRERGLDHVRSGDLVVLAQRDAHFTYYWWLDEAKAPPFARTVDIHAKPGFDAAELFFDPRRKCIPTTAEAVRGSHGLVLEDGAGWAAFLASDPPKELAGRKAVQATEVAHLLV